MSRNLTPGEIAVLQPIFKSTLRYANIVCDINKADVGGPGNSITPSGAAYFSKFIYKSDFSCAGPEYQWIFVHEMTHVWQWGHGIYPVFQAIGAFIENLGRYDKAYAYDLVQAKRFRDFNLEQQAAIVADYWAAQDGRIRPKYNQEMGAAVSDYSVLISELQKSGPPVSKLDETPSWP